MKKTFGYAILFFLIFISVSVGASPSPLFESRVGEDNNLIENAGIENLIKDDNGNITGVSSWFGGTVNWNEVIKTDGDCPEGNNYLRFSSSMSSSNVIVYPTASLTPGKSYKFSLWCKSNAALGRMKIEIAGLGSDQCPGFFYPNTDDVWKRITVVFTLPHTDRNGTDITGITRLQIRLGNIPKDGQYISFDGLHLEQIESYAGFYDNNGIEIRSDSGQFENFGAEVPSLYVGNIPFRFHAEDSIKKVTVVFVLYSYNQSKGKTIEDIDIKTVEYDETDKDVGFKTLININDDDITPGKNYCLEAYVWDNLNKIKPLVKATRLAMEVNISEFIINGGFESVKDSSTTNCWSVSGATFGQEVMPEKHTVKNGEYSLKMADDSANMYVTQITSGLMSGEEYTFSVWVMKAMEKKGSYASIKFEFFYINEKGQRQSVGEIREHIRETIDSSQIIGEWIEKRMVFTSPQQATSVQILLRTYNGGEFYWDEVSLTGPKGLELSPKASNELKTPLNNTGNLVKNGTFEELDLKGHPIDWRVVGNNWATSRHVFVDRDITYKGNASVRIEASSDRPWIRQIVEVEPNTEYQVRMWVRQRGNKEGSRNIRLKFEYYKDPTASSGTAVDFGYAMVSKGLAPEESRWVQMEQVFITPPQARAVAIYLRMYGGNGIAWFDNIEVYQTGEKQRFLIDTDQIFYYPETEKGMATVTLAMDYTDLSTGTVDFKLKDGSIVLKEQNNTNFAEDNKAFFEYDISLLSDKKKEYTIEAILKDDNANVVETRTTDIYCYDRPALINENGDYVVDGEVFIPTLGYGVGIDKYDFAKQVGVNVVQISSGGAGLYRTNPEYLTNLLDELHSRGLKGLVCLYEGMRAASHPDNIEDTKAVVAGLINHPGLFAYAVMDEPYSQIPLPEQYLKEAYKAIRNIDDIHPVYFVDPAIDKANEPFKYCDIYALNPYPAGSYEPAVYVQNRADDIRKAAEAFKKPFLVLNQAFEYGGYLPTMNELRSLWYQALLGGAHGGGYYLLSSIEKIPEHKDGLIEFAKEEQALSYDLLKYGNRAIYNSYKGSSYQYVSIIKDNEVYVILLNRDNNSKNVEVSLLNSEQTSSLAGGVITQLYGCEGLNPVMSGNNISVALDGRQAAVFKISGVNLP